MGARFASSLLPFHSCWAVGKKELGDPSPAPGPPWSPPPQLPSVLLTTLGRGQSLQCSHPDYL